MSLLCAVAIIFSRIPVASAWTQFHADSANSGFAALRTSPAIRPAWITNIGPVLHASPVVGPDRAVYIGNLNGELSAINPNGTVRWIRNLPLRQRIVASPAVGQDGNIYVIGSTSVTVRDHRDGQPAKTYQVIQSYLHSYDPSGSLRWSYTFPAVDSQGGFTSAAPKTWSDGQNLHVFVPLIYTYPDKVSRYLAVVNQSGSTVVNRYVSSGPRSELVAGGRGFWKWLADVLSKIPPCGLPCRFDTSGIPPVPLPENIGWPFPSIAISDRSSNANRPLIIMDDSAYNLVAFRWDTRNLREIWRKTDDKQRNSSSPAILRNGFLAVGQSNGFFKLYDPATGNELSKPWIRESYPITTSPTAFVRQMYFVSQTGKVVAVDTSGEVWKEAFSGAESMASPAMSATHIYVSAANALTTYGPDLKQVARYRLNNGGISSPVISPDGTLYVIADEKLYAFPRNAST